MKKLLQNNTLVIVGALAGGIGGYHYWKYAGCLSGTCLISSKPLNSTIYGGVMGALLFAMIPVKNRQPKGNSGKEEL
ncbi:MAG TPA: hypothetical protein VG842_08710 [Sediminibacterium sp.]|nr:hypothetical protein [Sediminibacterium sp.]